MAEIKHDSPEREDPLRYMPKLRAYRARKAAEAEREAAEADALTIEVNGPSEYDEPQGPESVA